jgi:hypothetical protein
MTKAGRTGLQITALKDLVTITSVWLYSVISVCTVRVMVVMRMDTQYWCVLRRQRLKQLTIWLLHKTAETPLAPGYSCHMAYRIRARNAHAPQRAPRHHNSTFTHPVFLHNLMCVGA